MDFREDTAAKRRHRITAPEVHLLDPTDATPQQRVLERARSLLLEEAARLAADGKAADAAALRDLVDESLYARRDSPAAAWWCRVCGFTASDPARCSTCAGRDFDPVPYRQGAGA